MQYPPDVPQGVPPPGPPLPVAPQSKSKVWIFVLVGGCCVGLLLMVVVLPALLFPTFATARESARMTSCMSNVKQSSLGVLMYMQDFDTKFPAAQRWMTDIKPYTKNDALFHCPSAATFNEGNGPGNEFGYAFNGSLSQLEEAKVKTPEMTGMIYDSSTTTENAFDALTSFPVPPRHRGNKYNVLGMTDGHCKALTPEGIVPYAQSQSDLPTSPTAP